MKNTIAALICLAAVMTVSPAASAQSVGTQTAAGAGGALVGGLGGLVIGTAGSLLFGPGEFEAAPPVAGLALGATAGLVAGVTAAGNATGGDGSALGTFAGAATGALSSAAFAGLIHVVSGGKPGPGAQQAFVVSMVALPVAGAVVGYGISF